ncbi:hypothetical protein SIN_02876 [Salmonella enterica subsp. enterica serovar Infantis]|nr:hypothetical protein SIN_02876 [Salmonella enterica subsp. enterica serovar Infantis]
MFPAPAGINRGQPFKQRCSGDKPTGYMSLYVMNQCSPRQRG